MNTEEHYKKSHNCNDEEHFSSTKTPVGTGNQALTGGTGGAISNQPATGGQIPTGTGSGYDNTGAGYNDAGTGGAGYNTASTGAGTGTGYNDAGQGYGSSGTGAPTGAGYNNTGTGAGYNNTGTGATGNPATSNMSTGQKIASAIPGTAANREKKAMQGQY